MPDIKTIAKALREKPAELRDPSSAIPLPFEPDEPSQGALDSGIAEASLSHAGADGWVGWVLRSTVTGWQWARVTISAELLPFVVHGKVQPGDMRANVAAYIERDMLSDKLNDPTRWRP